MTDAINTPLGIPGSGRQRYAAAMALHFANQLSDAALEVYRICSPLDAQDPRPLLQAIRAPIPKVPQSSANAVLRHLVKEIDLYLATHPGPGVAETRMGIASISTAPDTARTKAPACPVLGKEIMAHLPAALSAVQTTHPALAFAMKDALPQLIWQVRGLREPDETGTSGHAFAPIVGTNGPIRSGDLDLGLLLIAPLGLWRDHSNASTLFAPLTGPHGWCFGQNKPLIIKPAHIPVLAAPAPACMIQIGTEPFLAICSVNCDVARPSKVVAANGRTVFQRVPQ